MQLKNELETHTDLSEKFSTLSMQEAHQGGQVNSFQKDVDALQATVDDYE